jgi:hypothetical protein
MPLAIANPPKSQIPEFQIRRRRGPTQAEQDGTGQPVTRPESKSETGDKPQLSKTGRGGLAASTDPPTFEAW